MNRKCSLLMLLVAFSMHQAFNQDLPDTKESQVTKFALEFVNQLQTGQFAAATARFDSAMLAVMPTNTLATTWETVEKQAGAFQHTIGTRIEYSKPYTLVFVHSQFAAAQLNIRVVFDPQQKIAGLFVQPYQPDYDFTPPTYVDETAFTEEDITIGQGEWELPGTLSLPTTQGPHPLIILVHGSGPNDRDETMGPNKVFRDLAWGLASQGIAVLRYDKRTRVYGNAKIWTGNFTVEDEVTEDVLVAVEQMIQDPGIDPERVFILGHSLGGMMAPEFGHRSDKIAGLIILAGASRPMCDLLVDQYHYIFNLDQVISPQEQDLLDEMVEKVARVNSQELTVNTPRTDLPMDVPASYWLHLRKYEPAQVASNLSIPMLILQGERDYQVTMADLAVWKESLSGKKNVKFITYPSLNHLFISGSGPSQPAEYQIPGHVEEALINDIATWIKTH